MVPAMAASNERNAPERLKDSVASRMIASHSQADGRILQARRVQNPRLVFRKDIRLEQLPSFGSKLRAMTKPDMAKNRSTPAPPSKYLNKWSNPALCQVIKLPWACWKTTNKTAKDLSSSMSSIRLDMSGNSI